jgi:hypothetical protein
MKKVMLLAGLMACTLGLRAGDDPNEFLGRWALFLPGGAGWLEVRQEPGYLDADILWYGGSVVPVGHVYRMGDQLIVTRSSNAVRQKDGKTDRTHVVTQTLELEVFGDLLLGRLTAPKNDGSGVVAIRFTGKRIPDLPAAPRVSDIKFGKPVELFNGVDLSGWELTSEGAVNGWKVENGVLVNDPVQKPGEHIAYGNLRTVQEFEDFNLKLKVNIPKGSNSGIYLKGIYEVQVMDSYGRELDSHNMGAVYSRITPSQAAEKPAGEWQDLDITLCDRHVTVVLNGKKIIDNQPLMGVTGGALTADEFAPGPIYLQGDHGKVMYRDIRLSPVLK